MIESKATQGHWEYPRVHHHEKAGKFGCRFHLRFGEADIGLTHSKEKHENGIGGGHIEEKWEVPDIPSSDARAYPGAVMVMQLDAAVALVAMKWPRGTQKVTGLAIPQFIDHLLWLWVIQSFLCFRLCERKKLKCIKSIVEFGRRHISPVPVSYDYTVNHFTLTIDFVFQLYLGVNCWKDAWVSESTFNKEVDWPEEAPAN